ncbi:hypothetical protein G7Z17_g10440 [Cylindrodendrum hubeiense]|uniref:Tr-type G domain-containing protein n=1 Tax=Cylindrodendrum hubeiense TaxID=595255 RepID=A0A9P5LCN0_9HYPO|nr:hypothetical protein G7Z17_g10440 [Cylindrodendrum hubeiense]
MPEARLSSSHDLTASSSSSTVAVPVPVQLPSSLSASTPTDSRLHQHHHYHQHHQYPNPDPSRPAHPPSLSFYYPTSPNPESFAGRAAARPPRSSSLLPPPHITPASQHSSVEAPRQPSPGSGYSLRPQTPPRSSHSAAASRSPTNNPAEVSWLLNRWSTSTAGSSRTSQVPQRATHSRFGSRGSVDATSFLNKSPPTGRPSPRKLQKNRRPSVSSISKPNDLPAPAPPSEDSQPPQTLPPIATLSPLEPPNLSEYLQVRVEGAGPGSTERRLPSVARQESQSLIPPGTAESTDQITTAAFARPAFAAAHQPRMPYDYEGEAHMPRGHSRSRSGKGSHEKSRGTKPASQKAMLSRALQKANTAVQLDNAQNFEGAREAYAEACELLRQVLQKTTGDEDKRKLEAIRRTYTSRIEELDQIAPWLDEDTKALPSRPDSDVRHLDSESILHLDDEDAEEVAVFETATITRVIRDDSRSPHPQHVAPSPSRRANKPKPIITTLTPEPGLLQSSFSRSPIHLRSPDPFLLQRPSDYPYMPAPLSPRRPPSPQKAQEDIDAPVPSDFALATSHPVEATDAHHHGREDSLNSWLDPIDESGGSTSSSVHSRTSSLGFRRKHIRAASGNTEAEFDTALDAAIEAAYDEGYEPMSPTDDYRPNKPDEPNEEAVANALRKVEIARERVRQTEQEAFEIVTEMERQRQPQPPLQQETHNMPEDFFDDNSSDEEERILEEMARDYGIEQFAMDPAQRPSVPRESDSSGRTTRTWHSSSGSNPPTTATSLSTVTEMPPPFPGMPTAPAAPPPTGSLPELPPPRPSSAAQSVRNRRLSGQNPKQLKIETAKLGPPLPPNSEDITPAKSTTTDVQDTTVSASIGSRSATGFRRPSSPPLWEASPTDDLQAPASPFRHLGPVDEDDNTAGRSSSPNVSRLRKNFSSSSLRSMKSRNMSITNLDENSDMSPGTPSSNTPFGTSRTPAVPALPTPLAAAFRDRLDTAAAGLSLFDDNFHSPTIPGSPNSIIPDTLAHPRGGYLSSKLFVPREVWRVKGVKLKNIEDKVANCDFLTAALLKIAKVDTFDADAVLEEMQSLEGVLEQVQSALTRKLGNEVGVQGSSILFKDASNGTDGDPGTGMPRSSSVSGKSAFSWRRLRSKNSAVGLGGAYNGKSVGPDAGKDIPGIPSLPMTGHPTSRPAKRDLTQAQFTGPNAMYMSSLARLFDAAQAIDQIARQVEDPGLRHADKTQVGLELCTRHAAEFFGFYVSMSLAWSTGRAWTRQCLPQARQWPGCRPRAALLALPSRSPPRRAYAVKVATKPTPSELEARIAAIPIDRYRNFCIVAHIDHGKSTLSDRLLEHTGTISASDGNKQILDKLDVERERGITVKAQTCTMIYNHHDQDYLLHLVDTPGHVDFRAEVTRSYASCGGALLLVDATQGIQAQTVSNFHLAFAQDLDLVPVVNKIDMPAADVPRVLEQMENTFELDPKDAILLSAKTGKGVPALLPAVIERIPPPQGDKNKPLKMLLVDSWYDNFRGVVLLVRVFDGMISAGDNVVSLGTGMKYTVGQVGIQYPHATPQQVLRAGQVGYVYFNPGMKRIQDAKLGDTFTTLNAEEEVKPLPGFEEPKPMVFVAAFPTDQSDYGRLADSITQLVLNDRSVTLQKDHSEALGAGWRLGFLGSLHCSVFQDRLRQEHGRSVILTEPSVPTKIVWADGSEEVVQNPALFPDQSHPRIRGAQLYEPYVKCTVTLPEEYLGRVIELCEANRGEQKSIEFFNTTQVILVYDIPSAQLVDDLFGKLKSATKGYATLDYEDAGWRQSHLVKLQLMVNRQPVDAISRVVHNTQVDRLGRHWVTKFKQHVDRQMFEVVIQATVGSRIVARETIKPFRKDVLAKLHAADVSRRKKLLERQKEGRKRLRAVGNVIIDQSAFQSFLSK